MSASISLPGLRGGVSRRRGIGIIQLPPAVMEGAVHLFQVFVRHVGVDLGGGDALVPQHLLDRPDVRPAAEKVGGKRMTQRVRGGLYLKHGGPGIGLHDPLHRPGCQPHLLPVLAKSRPAGVSDEQGLEVVFT